MKRLDFLLDRALECGVAALALFTLTIIIPHAVIFFAGCAAGCTAAGLLLIAAGQ